VKAGMKTKKRFSVVKVEDAKWMVLDARERTYVWKCQTLQDAQKFADAQNAKERLRTAKIVSVEPLADYLARQKNRDCAKTGEQST
jgi:hypothetical protein